MDSRSVYSGQTSATAAAVVVVAAAAAAIAAAAEQDDEDQNDPDGVVAVVAEHIVYPFSAQDFCLSRCAQRQTGRVCVSCSAAERRRSPLSPLSYAAPGGGVTEKRPIPANRRM